MGDAAWSEDIDIRIPSPARMYDYWLGGSHNFAADREAAEQVLVALPNARDIAVANRRFLRNVVLHMVHLGVRQFLDIGSGIPTVGNVHELVTGGDPSARVLYVDTDPVAVAHSVALLGESDSVKTIRADLRHPEAILAHDVVRTMLDFTRPLGLLMVSMLHFVPDADAYPAVALLRRQLAPGSYLAISHVAVDALAPASTSAVGAIYKRSTTPTSGMRNRAEIGTFFDGFTLVPPGLVWMSQWDPDSPAPPPAGPDPAGLGVLAGLARKDPAG